jgi:hypothetical protein
MRAVCSITSAADHHARRLMPFSPLLTRGSSPARRQARRLSPDVPSRSRRGGSDLVPQVGLASAALSARGDIGRQPSLHIVLSVLLEAKSHPGAFEAGWPFR